MLKEFEGDLSEIDPKKLVGKDPINKVENLFLALGVIFNDLKGYVFLEKNLYDSYRNLGPSEISAHGGNHAGIVVHTRRLLASAINEFFIFLKKYQDVMQDSEFKEVLGRINADQKSFWHGLNDAAAGQSHDNDKRIQALAIIRNNITFHYDHSGKKLREGFRSRFSENATDERSRKAYYSIGENIAQTRFYFSDAAAEEAMYLAIGKKPNTNHASDPAVAEFTKLLHDAIEAISVTLSALLKEYIRVRRARQI